MIRFSRSSVCGGLSLAILLLVTGIVYAPLRTGGYVFEDQPPSDWGGWRAELATLGLPVTPRSLTGLTQRFQGADPHALHVGNVAVHLLNALLLAAVLGLSLRSLFVIGLFLLHPLQTEAVSYLAARADLLLVTCTLLALCASTLHGWARWPLMALCCVAAVSAKETGIVVAPLVLLWDWAHGRRVSKTFLCAGLVFALAVSYRLLLHLDSWTAPAPPVWRFLTVQSAAILRLHALIGWPTGLTIAHDWARVSPLIGTLALCGLVSLAVVAWWQRSKPVALAVGWDLIALAPRLLVPLPQYLTEHHLYLPTLGLVLAAGLSRSDV